jgi:hypothetical protein
MPSPKLSVSWLCGLLLIPVCVGCLSSGTQRRRPLPRRDNERAATIQPASAPAAGDAAATPTPAGLAATTPSAAPAATPPVPAAATPQAPAAPTTPQPLVPGQQSVAPAPRAGGGAPAEVRALYSQAATQFAAMDCYSAQLRRREQVNGRDKPVELMQCKFRKNPYSVAFKWLGPEAKGREVVFVKGQHGDLIHTLLAAGDMPFMGAGKIMSLPPDNMFVRSSSRHAITEAGFGSIIATLGQTLDALDKGDRRMGTLRPLGPVKRPEFTQPLEGVEHMIPPGAEPQLSQGGKRLLFFEATTRLPVLILTSDHRGTEVEYYCYERVQLAERFTDDDFNPDRVWKK